MTSNTDLNLKDHDILIATYTLQQELIRRFDDYIKSNDARHLQTERELNAAGRHRERLDGEITSLKGHISNLNDKIDSMGLSNRWLNVAAVLGSIIAGAISILVWIR